MHGFGRAQPPVVRGRRREWQADAAAIAAGAAAAIAARAGVGAVGAVGGKGGRGVARDRAVLEGH